MLLEIGGETGHVFYIKVYHRILLKKTPTLWEEYESANFPGSLHTMGFVEFSQKSIFQAFPIRWIFPCLGKLTRKLMHFPYDKVYSRIAI